MQVVKFDLWHELEEQIQADEQPIIIPFLLGYLLPKNLVISAQYVSVDLMLVPSVQVLQEYVLVEGLVRSGILLTVSSVRWPVRVPPTVQQVKVLRMIS